MILIKNNFNRIPIFFIYFIFVTFLLKDILFSPDIISGGDWGLPGSVNQLNVYFEKMFTSWTNNGNLFGA